MVTYSTHHTHTSYVDGQNTAREMAEAALARGFTSIGFSEHGQQPFDPAFSLTPESEAGYVREVLALKALYAGRLSVHLGLELDQYGRMDDHPFEYVIGSKHYLDTPGGYFSVDEGPAQARSLCQKYFGGDWMALSKRYFSELTDFILEARPQVIGHFDLMTKFNEGGACFDEGDPTYLRAGCAALERMAATDALLEVNTGAIARGYRTVPYPALPFLTRWRELKGRVILGSDCHNRDRMDAGYEVAEALMRRAGYREAWRLGREAGFEPYPLTRT